jgi:hypothetical protein
MVEAAHIELEPDGDPHRRQAAHLYGLIVSAAVLATAPEEFRLVRVALLLFGTLVVYWAAESYVHWIAARTLVHRDLTPAERRAIIRDGWPLVAACGVPVAFLALEAIARIETPLALDLALALNTVLLLGVGWQMGRSGGLTGLRLLLATAATGLLGIVMVALKVLLH